MRVAVIIPTTRGRKDLLPRLLEHLENQTSPPGEVIVSAPDESHVTPYCAAKLCIALFVWPPRLVRAAKSRA